jgi:hypothetical protein
MGGVRRSFVELAGQPVLEQPSGSMFVFDFWHPHRLATSDERAMGSASADVWTALSVDFVSRPTLADLKFAFSNVIRNFLENSNCDFEEQDRFVFD